MKKQIENFLFMRAREGPGGLQPTPFPHRDVWEEKGGLFSLAGNGWGRTKDGQSGA
jgi:hypothetical protein